MKHGNKIATIPLPIFTVTIGNTPYTTSAYTSHAAISKAAYRYGMDNGIGVGLVQWKIRNKELMVDVVNIETERT